MQLNYVKPWHATDLRIRPGPEKLKQMVGEYGIYMIAKLAKIGQKRANFS